METGEILIYQAPNGNIKIDVRLEDETVYLTQDQMATLFGKGRTTLPNIFKIFLTKVSWMKMWHVGISDTPLNMVLLLEKCKKEM